MEMKTEPQQRAVAAEGETTIISERLLTQNDLDNPNIPRGNVIRFRIRSKIVVWEVVMQKL